MSQPILTRLKNAWNIFRNKEEIYTYPDIGISSTVNPFRTRSQTGLERSMIMAPLNRMAMDVASCQLHHVKVDQDERFIAKMESSLEECLTTQANKDQTGRAFVQDIASSLFDEGVVAIVPTEADFSPIDNPYRYEIYALRTGKIVEWYPDHVRVELYNDIRGVKERFRLPKNTVGIVENPLYYVMNEPNSTMRRLVNKLLLLDNLDSQNSNGKLDLIIQLPYAVKSEARQKQAEGRRKALEDQLMTSQYGVAYMDGTERITQLNRPVENNLLTQITYLATLLYSQLGITEDVFNGKADEKAMLNYYNRTINPIVRAITEEMNRKFLTKTARTQGQRVKGFRDMFELVSIGEMAEAVDSFTRNEIMTSNEVRAIFALRPSNSPNANELRNKQMPSPSESIDPSMAPPATDSTDYDKIFEEMLSSIEGDITNILGASNE